MKAVRNGKTRKEGQDRATPSTHADCWWRSQDDRWGRSGSLSGSVNCFHFGGDLLSQSDWISVRWFLHCETHKNEIIRWLQGSLWVLSECSTELENYSHDQNGTCRNHFSIYYHHYRWGVWFDFRTRLLSKCWPNFTHSINLVQFHSSIWGIHFIK